MERSTTLFFKVETKNVSEERNILHGLSAKWCRVENNYLPASTNFGAHSDLNISEQGRPSSNQNIGADFGVTIS